MAIRPITRYYLIIVIAFFILNAVGILPKYYTLFLPQYTFSHLELWRVVTGFFVPFYQQITINFILGMFFDFFIFQRFEEMLFPIRKGNFVFLIIMLAIFIVTLSNLMNNMFTYESLKAALAYLFAKFNPNQQIRLYMFIEIKYKYLIFIELALSLITGGTVIAQLIGLISGHLVFYLLFLLPVVIDRSIFKAPPFLSNLLDGIQ